MQKTISRASLILGALSQHLFGARFAQARAGNAARAAQPSGSKPAGNRGMHAPHVTGGFRPMAHGKLGKRSSGISNQAKRNHRRAIAGALQARTVPILKAA